MSEILPSNHRSRQLTAMADALEKRGGGWAAEVENLRGAVAEIERLTAELAAEKGRSYVSLVDRSDYDLLEAERDRLNEHARQLSEEHHDALDDCERLRAALVLAYDWMDSLCPDEVKGQILNVACPVGTVTGKDLEWAQETLKRLAHETKPELPCDNCGYGVDAHVGVGMPCPSDHLGNYVHK